AHQQSDIAHTFKQISMTRWVWTVNSTGHHCNRMTRNSQRRPVYFTIYAVCATSDNDFPVTGKVSRDIVRDLDAVAGCRTCTGDRKAIVHWHCEYRLLAFDPEDIGSTVAEIVERR